MKSIAPTGPSPVITAPEKASAAKNPELERACKELEGVFLRQLLQAAKFGESAGQGYGPMVVDSLASAISDGGGLGLSDRIREALERSGAK